MVSKYDGLEDYKNASAEERLAALASEMMRPISTIAGFSSLIQERFAREEIEPLEELSEWISKIVEAANDLTELREILTLQAKTK